MATPGLENRMAERLNEEPPIFRGCSSSELLAILVLAVIGWLPVGILLGFVVGAPMMGVGFAAIAVLGTVFITATIFQKIKRGRPTGYYQQRAMLALHRSGLRKVPVTLRSGTWDLGRRS
nr:TIGR03750 family conjugal transfer protein [Thioalkalivibrio sp. ALMg9]